MLDKKDLEAIEKMFDTKLDKKFAEFEEKLDKKIDAKLDARFAKFSQELAEVLTDFTYTIDKRFTEMEAKFDKKFANMEAKFDKKFADMETKFDKKVEEQNKRLDRQDKKLDFLLNCYKENLEQHKSYNDTLSKINSKLFDHDLRLDSLENTISTAAI